MNVIQSCYRSVCDAVVPESLKPKFGMVSEAEISEIAYKVAQLDSWKTLTTTVSVGLLPSCVPSPFNILKPEELTSLPALFNLRHPVEIIFFPLAIAMLTLMSAIFVPVLAISGTINGMNLGENLSGKLLCGIASTIWAVAAAGVFGAVLSISPGSMIVITLTLFVASRVLKHMRNNEIASITERNGGRVPTAVVQACPDAIQWNSLYKTA